MNLLWINVYKCIAYMYIYCYICMYFINKNVTIMYFRVNLKMKKPT